MQIDIYAGPKKMVSLMQYYEYDPVQKVLEYRQDKYAIPGGKVRTEKQIRKWASEYGYTVKTQYEEVDYV